MRRPASSTFISLPSIVLGLLAGCNSAASRASEAASRPLVGTELGSDALGSAPLGSAPLGSAPLGSATLAQRRRESRTTPLFALAREVGAEKWLAVNAVRLSVPSSAAPSFAASASSDEPAALASDAGTAASDAGAPAPTAPEEPPPPQEPPAPEEPLGLPRDIVEQSALPLYGLEAGIRLEEAALWDRLAESPAICFGEYHDVPAHHYAQTRALDELAARAERDCRPFAVGYEMFQRPFQAPLSAFVAGDLDEAEFLAQTEYATRWGYDFALYRPLLERTRDHALPALALNMQREITRKIGRTGLASLSEEERALLPELVLDDAEHRAYIFGLFGILPEHAEQFGLENVYVAQTVWDETMADTAARWLVGSASSEGGPASVLAFAGGVHCHRSAIPRRISRRTGEPALSVHAVFESELEDGSFSPDGYDLLVVLDDS